MEASNYAVKDISAYLDNGAIDTTQYCYLPQTQFTPQVSNSGSIISDTMNWIKIEGSFIANGTESFITIGNFKDKAHTTVMTLPFNSYNGAEPVYAAYLIDDVSVVETDLSADAGPDTQVVSGDSVYIGRPPGVGPECTWSILGDTIVIGSGIGIWVKPKIATSYVVTQTVCRSVKRDTVSVEVLPAGVNKVNGKMQEYTLAPNPSDGYMQIAQLARDGQQVTIYVYEAIGKLVYSSSIVFQEGKATLDLTGLGSGFYFVELQDGFGNQYRLRFLKR